MNALTTYWLCRAPGSETEGPFALEQIQCMYQSGAITAQAMLCREGDEVWVSALDELQSSFTPPQPIVRRAKKKRKSKAGCGPACLFLIGLLFLVIFWPMGLALIFLALILDHMSYYRACSLCGNEVAKSSRECPWCKARF